MKKMTKENRKIWRTKRRTACSCLILAIAFLLAGCSGETETAVKEETTKEAEISKEEKQEREDSEGAEEAENTEAAESLGKSENIQLYVSYDYMGEWQAGQAILTAKYPQVNVPEEGYEELQAALNVYSEETVQKVTALYEENLPDEMEMWSNGWGGGASIEYLLEVRRSDEHIVSMVQEENLYFSGAPHIDSYQKGINLDPQTGEMLTLKDVASDYDKMLDYTLNQLEEDYGSEDILWEDYEETVRSMFAGESVEPLEWFMDRRGVTICFNTYVLSTYASGSQYVQIPFKGNEDLFQEKYVITEGALAIPMSAWSEETADVSGDGQEDLIFLSAWNNEETYEYELTIACNGEQYSTTGYGEFTNAYLMISETGNGCLYVETGEYENYTIDLYAFPDGKPVFLKTMYDQFGDAAITSPEEFILYSSLDILGTYTVWRSCSIQEDGTYAAIDPVYQIAEQYGERTLTTAIPIDALRYEKALFLEKKTESTIPAGTVCIVKRTDGETFVEVELYDGTRYEIPVEKKEDGWGWTVNGIDEWECFETVPYAG